MKRAGEFRLAVQHGQRGYFGDIQLEVEVLEDGSGVEISIPEDVDHWRHGICFGIAYACEKSRTLRAKAARVRDIDARGHAVDTTEEGAE